MIWLIYISETRNVGNFSDLQNLSSCRRDIVQFSCNSPMCMSGVKKCQFLGKLCVYYKWMIVVWNKFHKIIHNFGYFIAVNVPFGHSVTQLTVVQWLLLLHNFIQLSLNSGSAQVQTLLAACQRFAMVRISDNGPGWK